MRVGERVREKRREIERKRVYLMQITEGCIHWLFESDKVRERKREGEREKERGRERSQLRTNRSERVSVFVDF